MIKTLSIIVIIAIIAVAGWVVGIKTFTPKQGNNNTNTLKNEEKDKFTPKKDAIIFATQTNEAITLDGVYPGIANIDDENLSNLTHFYTYDLVEKNSIPTFAIKENRIMRSANSVGDVNRVITLNGKEVDYVTSNRYDPFKEDTITIYSSDKSLSAEVLPITQTKINIKGKIDISFSIDKLPHEMQSMGPVGFSSDNSKLFFTADAIGDEKGDRSGLYEYAIASGEIKEMQYSGDSSDTIGINKDAAFSAFDPNGAYVYFLNKVGENKRKITRMNIESGKNNDVLTDLQIASWQIHFINSGNSMIIDDIQGQVNIYFVDLKNNKTSKLPVIGEYFDILSDGKSFIYRKDNVSTDTTGNVNMQSYVTEYYLYDIDSGKNSPVLGVANSIKNNGVETVSDKTTVLGILRPE